MKSIRRGIGWLLCATLMINTFSGAVVKAAGEESVVFAQSRIVTHPGEGFEGADVSSFVAGNGERNYGFYIDKDKDTWAVDDFTVSERTTLTGIGVFSFQLDSLKPEYNYMNVRIIKDDVEKEEVVWEDPDANQFDTAVFTGCYRSVDTDLTDTKRPVFKVNAKLPNVVLEPGTYYVEYTLNAAGTDKCTALYQEDFTNEEDVSYIKQGSVFHPVKNSVTGKGLNFAFELYGNNSGREISSVQISGLSEPEVGSVILTDAFAADDRFDITDVKWTYKDGTEEVPEDSVVFESCKEYSLAVTLKAKEGFHFAKEEYLKTRVNDIYTEAVLQADGSLVMNYTFETIHDWQQQRVTRLAGLETAGERELYCTVCDKVKREEVPGIHSLALSEYRCEYDKNTKEPEVYLKDTMGNFLTRDVDYHVAYEDNKNVGNAVVRVLADGDYEGTFEEQFRIAQKPGTVVTVSSLKTLQNAMQDSDIVVQLRKDIDFKEQELIINGNYTLDLNGHTITSAGEETISLESGRLTVTDSSRAQHGKIVNTCKEGGCAIGCYGELVVEAGTLCGVTDAVYLEGNGTKAVINGGKLTVTGSKETETDVIYGENEATVLINGGEFAGIDNCIMMSDDSTLQLGGGKFTVQKETGYGTICYYSTDVDNVLKEEIQSAVLEGCRVMPAENAQAGAFENSHKIKINASALKGNFYIERFETVVDDAAKDDASKEDKKVSITSKPTAIRGIVGKKKALKVSWKKVKGVSGYQIQYAANKNFASARIQTVNDSNAARAEIKGLESGEKYLIRVRTFKKEGEETGYSDWSKMKTGTVR
ncbi:MAG: fibronectin type III domain-containing protein [Lachnospiraceae bacterium]|nr:fibronectin type III domain-containing protein [Lachnospiraceae bacterium]